MKSIAVAVAVSLACIFGLAMLQAPSYADEPEDAAAVEGAAEAPAPEAADTTQVADASSEAETPAEQPTASDEPAQEQQSGNGEASPADDGSAPSQETGEPASPTGENPAASDTETASSDPSQETEAASSQKDEAEAEDKAADEAQVSAEALEERQKKVDELQKKADEKIEVAMQAISEANEAANRLPAALSALSEAYAPLDEQRGSYSGLLAQGSSLNEQVSVSEARIAGLETALAQTREQLAQDVTIDLGQLLRGEVDLTQLEAMPYLLSKLATAHEQSLAQAKESRTQLQTQRSELDPVIYEAHSHVSDAIRSGNRAAFEIESICSEVRQRDKDAADALEELEKTLQEDLEKIAKEEEAQAKEAEKQAQAAAQATEAAAKQAQAQSSTDASDAQNQAAQTATATVKLPDPITGADVQGVEDAKQALAEARSWHDGERAAAQEQAGAWYDSIDALSSTVVDTPSFGVGDDFALSEPAFVTKWGNAIDAFYANWSASMGTQSPMQGLGKVMARSAYEHRIDPRLCAAVSIVESSGGIHCIKPYNAWGWGAADSDPSGLAFGWSAWDEAIDAWHEGVATNQAGLAHPVSLSGFGDIYCSTPIWGKNVAGYMLQIDDLAQDAGEAVQADTGSGTQEPRNVGSNAVDKSQLSAVL